MKIFFIACLILFFCFPVFSQTRSDFAIDKPTTTTGNVYAVVVGIANYENKNIPNLNFSNRDAQLFAEYLQSKAGGGVPSENIRLLIDSSATMAAVYNAMRWLKQKCEAALEQNKSDNTVYFYFSGHGDVESETLRQLGFLLCYNSHSNNYINNAFRLEDLNEYAHALSVNYKAKVILITDACHSGKLAGSDFKASTLIGKALSTVKENEIRIASCSPDELANEHEGWGGGRGVFSYYLLNGLRGLADYDLNNIVTLNEIKRFLDSSIATDQIIKENKLKQTPLANGNNNFQLASVNKEELQVVQQSLLSKIRAQSDEEYFFSLLKQKDIFEKINFLKLKDLRKQEIPKALILQVADSLAKLKRINHFSAEQISDSARVYQLYNSLKIDPSQFGSFIPQLVEALHTNGQKIINLYLEGDAAELERRRYYNSSISGYDQYPVMYEVALKLTDQDDPLYNILQVNKYYFTGVALRLKIPLTVETRQIKLIDDAIAALKKALALEENAAYIYNELGSLYMLKKDLATSKKYFLKATEISPVWSIPWANLCGLYAVTKKFTEALDAANMAESLQPDQHGTKVNLGILNEIKENYLLAEEFYRKAIEINSRHYYPFERLGFVYMNTTKYALADSFFHEAELRKKGFHFNGNDWLRRPEIMVLPAVPAIYCYVDPEILKPDDIMAFFTWGVQEYKMQNYSEAVRILKKVIALDHKNPLVFYYMGKIFYDQKKWEDAEIMFNYAKEYYIDEETFQEYCDSIIEKANYPYEHLCFETFFRTSYYNKIENHFFMASVYEQWAHFYEAEDSYREIIEMEPESLGAYIKLWRLLEKMGRFNEAEEIIISYYECDATIADQELFAFYNRTINHYSGNDDQKAGEWNYRMGSFLYGRLGSFPRIEFLDSIVYFPLLNREQFVDKDLYLELENDPQLKIFDTNIQGSPMGVPIQIFNDPPKFISMPGTGERVGLAHKFYTPRKDAINYLSKAAEIFTENETLADINHKIGNIYVWAGSKKQAYPYYEKALQLTPSNANMRMALIDVCTTLYRNQTALEHLNYLFDSLQINFKDRLLLAEFSIHEGQFAKGKKMLDEAKVIHPFSVPKTDELLGRMYLLSKQHALAISAYKKYFATEQKDPHTLYSLAKLYALSGNKNEAWKLLERSISNGFDYSYILKADTAWAELRKTSKWNVLMKKFPAKIYFEPQLIQIQTSSSD